MGRGRPGSSEQGTAPRPISLAAGWGRGLTLLQGDPGQARQRVENLLARAGEGDGRVVHEARNRVVILKAEAPGSEAGALAVKLFAPPGAIRRFESLWKPCKARRAFLAAAALSARGLPTPEPVAYLEERRRGMLGRSVLITAAADGAVQAREIFKARHPGFPRGASDDFVRQLAGVLKRLHDAGFVHRDLSDGNILVTLGDDGEPGFLLVDLNRLRRKRRVSRVAGLGDIIRVGVPPELQPVFLAAYLGGEAPAASWLLYRFLKRAFETRLALKRALRRRRRRAA